MLGYDGADLTRLLPQLQYPDEGLDWLYEIRTLLRHLEQAWSLLTELKAASVSASAPEPNPVADAIASCEQWQATGLVRVRALLLMTLPSIAAFMFHDFEAGEGTAAVLNVATFLQRRKELETGANRKDSRKADQEALRIMEETGLTKSAVKHLEAMIARVQSASVAEAPAELSSALDVTRADVLRPSCQAQSHRALRRRQKALSPSSTAGRSSNADQVIARFIC